MKYSILIENEYLKIKNRDTLLKEKTEIKNQRRKKYLNHSNTSFEIKKKKNNV